MGDSVRTVNRLSSSRSFSIIPVYSNSDIGSIAVLDRAEGHALVSEGKPEEALAFYEKALQTFRHKQETWHIMDTLHRFGEALLQCRRMKEASAVLQEALQFAEAAGDPGRAAFLRKIIDEFPQKNIS